MYRPKANQRQAYPLSFFCVCSSLVLPTHSDRNLIELIALTFFSTLLSRDHIKEQQQQSTTTTAKKTQQLETTTVGFYFHLSFSPFGQSVIECRIYRCLISYTRSPIRYPVSLSIGDAPSSSATPRKALRHRHRDRGSEIRRPAVEFSLDCRAMEDAPKKRLTWAGRFSLSRLVRRPSEEMETATAITHLWPPLEIDRLQSLDGLAEKKNKPKEKRRRIEMGPTVHYVNGIVVQ